MEENDVCSRHFKKELLYMDYHDPSRFVHPPWNKRKRVYVLYLLYRLILCPYFIGTFIWGAIEHYRGGRYFTYLTNWGYLSLMGQMLSAAYIVLKEFIRERRGKSTFDSSSQINQKMPISYKIFWGFSNISAPLAIYISIEYWCFVYSMVEHKDDMKIDGIFHIGNTVFAIAEVFIAGTPIRLLHIVQPVIFAMVYNIFNLIYVLAGGDNMFGLPFIYPFWNWWKPMGAIHSSISFVAALMLIFVLFWILAGIRSRVGRRFGLYHTETRFQMERPSPDNFNKAYVKDIV